MNEAESTLRAGAVEGCAVSDAALLRIGGPDGAVYWGCDQEWFPTKWQRMSGCGPTTAASLLLYSRRLRGEPPAGQEECLALMQAFWKYVTPTWKGVYSTEYYIACVQRYARAHGLNVTARALDVPAEHGARPSLGAVVDFLAEALRKDLPVAFLNHNNGGQKALYSHHWVVVTALSGGPDAHTIDFLDESIVKRIDIGKWLSDTKTGGGFVTLRWEDGTKDLRVPPSDSR